MDLQSLKSHLRVEHDDEDGVLGIYLQAAIEVVEGLLGKEISVYTDVPSSVSAAVLLYASHLYENREATTNLKLTNLPMGVDLLLWREREKTI